MSKDVGLRLRSIRKEKKLTQNELSQILGVGQTMISDYEIGKSDPSLLFVFAIQALFGISAIWILTGEGEKEYKIGDNEKYIQKVLDHQRKTRGFLETVRE